MHFESADTDDVSFICLSFLNHRTAIALVVLAAVQLAVP